MSHIFISYSRNDREYARHLADHLLAAGFDVWIDDRIDYGEDWEVVIFDAIANSAAFIILMSPSSYQSKWVRREVQYADKKDKPQYPVLLEGEEFPRYGPTQFFNALEGALPSDEFLDELAESAPRKRFMGEDVVLQQSSESPVTPAEPEETIVEPPANAKIIGEDPASQKLDKVPALEVQPDTPPADESPHIAAKEKIHLSVPLTQKPRKRKRSLLIVGIAGLAVLAIGVLLVISSNAAATARTNATRTERAQSTQTQVAYSQTSAALNSLRTQTAAALALIPTTVVNPNITPTVALQGSVTLELTEVDNAECQSYISEDRMVNATRTTSSSGNYMTVDYEGIYTRGGSRLIYVPHPLVVRPTGDFLIYVGLGSSSSGRQCYSGVFADYDPTYNYFHPPGAIYINGTANVRRSPCVQDDNISYNASELVYIFDTRTTLSDCPSNDGSTWYRLFSSTNESWVSSSVADLVFQIDAG